MTRLFVGALLFALLPASVQAQVWYSRSGSIYRSGSGAVARYSTPFAPGGYVGGYAPRAGNFTWYSVNSGYSYAPQTGLPWRGQDLNYSRRDRVMGAGGSVASFSQRALRPARGDGRDEGYARKGPAARGNGREEIYARRGPAARKSANIASTGTTSPPSVQAAAASQQVEEKLPAEIKPPAATDQQ